MSERTGNTAATAEAHLRAFGALAPVLPGHDVAWLRELRAGALDAFAETGVPGRKIEEWKFTPLSRLVRDAFAPREDGAAPAVTKADAVALAPRDCAARLVFVNGVFSAELSQAPRSPDGITVTTLAAAAGAGDEALRNLLSTGRGPAEAMTDLNAAFMSDGGLIRIDDGMTLEQPVALVFIGAAGDQRAAHLRNLIVLGENARASVVETHAGIDGQPSAVFTNTVTDVHLGAGARLVHARIEDEGADALHLSRTRAAVAPGADYASLALATGGRLARLETDATFGGRDGRVALHGVYLGRDRQHLDMTTRVAHDHPGCTTDELFKGVLDDRAHGVFQGLIHVAPHAIRTDAIQKSHSLLLSDRAVADAKPELEILADDVKCAHGATVGDLDADALFYLAARGIEPATARRLLVEGFIGETIDRCPDAAVAAFARGRFERWLERKEEKARDE